MRFADRDEANQLNTNEELMIATSGREEGGKIIWITDEGEEIVLHEEERTDYIQALAADDNSIYAAAGMSDPFVRNLGTGQIIEGKPDKVQANPHYNSLSVFEGEIYATFGPNVYNISKGEKVKSDESPILEVNEDQLLGCNGANGTVFDVFEEDSITKLVDEFGHSVIDYQPAEEIFFIRYDRNVNRYTLESESGSIDKEGEKFEKVTKVGPSLYYSTVEDGETVIYSHPEDEIFRKEYDGRTNISDMTAVDRDLIDKMRGASQ